MKWCCAGMLYQGGPGSGGVSQSYSCLVYGALYRRRENCAEQDIYVIRLNTQSLIRGSFRLQGS